MTIRAVRLMLGLSPTSRLTLKADNGSEEYTPTSVLTRREPKRTLRFLLAQETTETPQQLTIMLRVYHTSEKRWPQNHMQLAENKGVTTRATVVQKMLS